jgi:hypothetical protein
MLFSVDDHCPELQHGERHTVSSDAFLAEERWTAILHLHHYCEDCHQRRGEDQQDRGDGHIEAAFDDCLPLRQLETLKVGEGLVGD